jgi:hypothetical protein
MWQRNRNSQLMMFLQRSMELHALKIMQILRKIFEVFTVVTMKNAVLWDVAPCRLQPPAHAGSSLADFSTLNMEAIHSTETSVHTRSTRRHIPEDGIHHINIFHCINANNFFHMNSNVKFCLKSTAFTVTRLSENCAGFWSFRIGPSARKFSCRVYRRCMFVTYCVRSNRITHIYFRSSALCVYLTCRMRCACRPMDKQLIDRSKQNAAPTHAENSALPTD